MKKLFFLTVNCLFVAFLNAQKYYSYENGRVTSEEKNNVTQEIQLVKSQLPQPYVVDGAISLILGAIAPKLIDAIPTLFYNPENYIKTSNANKSFLNIDGSITRLADLSAIEYRKKAGDEVLSFLAFSVNSAFKFRGYVGLKFESAKINVTPVKLKAAHHNINVSIELVFHYFDSDKNKMEHRVPPFTLGGIETGENYTQLGEKLLLIPNFEVLESIDIIITEVNGRKKDWDTYLSLYQENSAALQEFLLGLVPR